MFTTLQKFGLSKDDRDAGRSLPVLPERENTIVAADEAHRSQYDFIGGLARNLRDGLPNASFKTGDKNTRHWTAA